MTDIECSAEGPKLDDSSWEYFKARYPAKVEDLRAPRLGPVDPERCPVCGGLRRALKESLETKNATAGKAVLYAMRDHMVYGHPKDSRTLGRADG
ncbi:hypothetical protein AQI95_34395 [Streptomyces yokosukanensis]|uniref:Uncharacterized protein n=1 Tax=Streptomyces yokosukanensis TaxID=67386 RepID=A0A124HEF8_9ACTN|nr:hypothetical protein [Streptomyces yokosukanensis]KUN00598.1 hypothetical protein AQI95_34395 [Streptomyces yokosukanensis]